MKMQLLAAAAIVALSGTAAFAGEGAGDPFPYAAPARTYNMQTEHWTQAPGGLDDPYPFKVPGQGVNNEAMYRPAGSASEPQSMNSLPAGASNDLFQGPAVAVPGHSLSRTAAAQGSTNQN